MLHVHVRVTAEADHRQTKLRLVRSGAGVTFVPGARARLPYRHCVPAVYVAKGCSVVYAACRREIRLVCGSIPALRVHYHGSRLVHGFHETYHFSGILLGDDVV